MSMSARFCLLLALSLAACAPTAPTSSPADWAELADALSSDEYAETFVDEFKSRLEDVDADFADEQRGAVYQALYRGAEAQRQIVNRYKDAGPGGASEAARLLQAENARTDAAVVAVLTPRQVPIYRSLQSEVRSALAKEAARE